MSVVTGKPSLVEWNIAARPLPGQAISGDMHVIEPKEHGVLLAVIDGVGHGDEAGAAAQIAADILKKNAHESIISLVQRCHTALANTRGVVMTMASLDAEENTITWIGVGNVEGRLFRAKLNVSPTIESTLLRSGLVGLQLPALYASVMPVSTGDLLVFCTDGLEAGFEYSVHITETPQQIADRILLRHFKGSDDALVLVARYLGTRDT